MTTSISLIKSGSGCTVALEPLGLEPSFIAHFVGLESRTAEKSSKLRNFKSVAMEIRKNTLIMHRK